MYCKHCGKELKEGAAFCNQCGTQTNAAAPVVVSDEGKKLNVKELIGSLFTLGLIAVLVISYMQYKGKSEAKQKERDRISSSYQDLMEKYCHATEKLDDKEFIDCLIPYTITKEHKQDDYYKEIKYYVQNYLAAAQDYLNISDSSDCKIKLNEISVVSFVSGSRLNDIQEYYDTMYSNFGYRIVPEVQQAMDIECSFEWKDGKAKGIERESFTVAYLDGEGWYIADIAE